MTIFALSSGSGVSGVGIIRISGPETKKLISTHTKGAFPKPRVATLKKVNNIKTNEVIDEGLILWFPGPASYTGEDMAEIHIHGSRAVVQAIINSFSQVKNCRLAEPGEFTRVALQNGKINLLEAESIGDLIESETEIQRKQALKILSGHNYKIIMSWRERLLKILANIEAKIDFPEDDLPKNILRNVKLDSIKIKNEIKKILDDQKVGEIIREGFKIAILGPTNVGKSSLLNYLSRRDVAIVSEIAGTTRDVIETHLNIDGYPVVISDTAGIRTAKDEIEKKGIKLSLKQAEKADLNIVIIDPKSIDISRFLKNLVNEKAILVINKSDLGIKKLNKNLKKYKPLIISLKKEKNIHKLITKIKNKIKNKFIKHENILITRERHRLNLVECVLHIENFEKKKELEDFDKAAEDLRLATRCLGKITGKVDVEAILDSIFNDFCIGK